MGGERIWVGVCELWRGAFCFRRRKSKRCENSAKQETQEPNQHCKIPIVPNPNLEANKLIANAESEQRSPIKDDGQEKARKFSYRELATATRNFHCNNFLGEGGFGSVYKGTLDTGEMVAIKRLKPYSLQGEKEFQAEILMLSLLHHPNLIKMIGYCSQGTQRLLVLEFMPRGSLEQHLHDLGCDQEPLDWNTRMKIAAGAARGVNYLHNDANLPVIFRDLKPSNILLDEGFNSKLCDFGIAKFGPVGDQSHVSTRVMGTHGYCAPEYMNTGKLTPKSDTYSFGVVLLELISGQKAYNLTRGTQKTSLIEWARPLLKNPKSYLQFADPKLNGQFSKSGLCKAVELAAMCVNENADDRPSMHDVFLAMDYLASQRHRHTLRENLISASEDQPRAPENHCLVKVNHYSDLPLSHRRTPLSPRKSPMIPANSPLSPGKSPKKLRSLSA